MTPEELEEIPGIDPASIEFIQAAVVAYYSQFEDPGAEGASEDSASGVAVGEPGEPSEVAEPMEFVEETAEQVEETSTEGLDQPVDVAEVVSGEGPETVEQFGTIEDAGSPHNHAEGAGAERVPEKQ
jgi:hypothetical protein